VGESEKDVFSHIKQAIAKPPALYNPNFNKYFFLYTFASNTSLIVVIKQKDVQNNEWPRSFMSENLQGQELNYPFIDN